MLGKEVSNMETKMRPADFIQYGTQLLSIGTDNIPTITLPVRIIDGKPYVEPLYNEINSVREEYFGYDAYGNDV